MKRPPHSFVVAAIQKRLQGECTDWRRTDVCRALRDEVKILVLIICTCCT